MHGGREKNAPMSAGSVSWVCARIVDAAASRNTSPWAVPPRRIRTELGLRSMHFSWTRQSLTVCLCRASYR